MCKKEAKEHDDDSDSDSNDDDEEDTEDEEDDDVVEEEEQQQDETANQIVRFLWTRGSNMAAVGIVTVLFLCYPAVVASAAQLLDCMSVELAGGAVLSVLRVDPSVHCEGSRYERATQNAWAVLAVVGLGGPLFCAGVVLCGRAVDVPRPDAARSCDIAFSDGRLSCEGVVRGSASCSCGSSC